MSERPTPFLQVGLDVLDANIAAMARFAAERGLALRPHAKTHKAPELARRQLAAGAVGLTVATVSEAEVFAAAGAPDVFVAYPLWVDASRGARVRALAQRTRVTIGIDSVEGARALAANAPGTRVVVEVDSGQHRTGVRPAAAGPLAAGAAHAGLDVVGVFTFPGHSYAPDAREEAAADEAHALREARDSLSEHGVEPVVVSGGSTPSAGVADDSVLTEIRPGVYLFGDAQQWELGTMQPKDVGLWALGTVVSHGHGEAGERQIVLDTGSKTLGADRASYASGYGRLLDHPDARITQLSEHHAVVTWPHDELPAHGSRLRVVPNHVCAAVNLHDELVVSSAHDEPRTWSITARGANT